MNTVESYITKNPYGKEDECAKFTVDNIMAQFVLSDTTEDGFQYTFSFWVKSDVEGNVRIHNKDFAATPTWTKYIHTFEATGLNLPIQFTNQGTYYIYHAQLEIGNVATDWTEAPEDIIEEASKYATNYMAYDETNGLQIGNKRDDKWSGFRTRILPDSFDILDENDDTLASYGDDLIELGKRDSFHTQITKESFDIMEGDKTLASYGEDIVELGKNSQDTTIKMCDGLGQIRYVNVPKTPLEERLRDSLEISSKNIVLRGGENTTVISQYYDGENVAWDSSIRIYDQQIGLESRISHNIDPESQMGTWDSSSIYLYPGGMNVSTDMDLVMYSGMHTTLASIFGSINLSTDYGNVNINGRAYGVNKVLWSGELYMYASYQNVTLSEAISSQPHGIVLVWSEYSGGAAMNQGFWHWFIPKQTIINHAGCFHTDSQTSWTNHSTVITKGVYISDTTITGHSCSTTGHVLRYVIGV